MSRSLVTLRVAEVADAPQLAELWSAALRRAEHQDHVLDLEDIIRAAAVSTAERLVVADYDGQLAGAVYLRVSTINALNLEQTVQILAPHVFPHCRRHGIGRLLMESAVSFAEEQGISLISTAAGSGSRDANRFLARLSFAPHAMMRLAPTIAVRARLEAQRPTLATMPTGGRQVTKVLAARRSMRRSQATSYGTP